MIKYSNIFLLAILFTSIFLIRAAEASEKIIDGTYILSEQKTLLANMDADPNVKAMIKMFAQGGYQVVISGENVTISAMGKTAPTVSATSKMEYGIQSLVFKFNNADIEIGPLAEKNQIYLIEKNNLTQVTIMYILEAK